MLVDFCLPIKNEALILNNSVNNLLSYCERSGFDFSWRIVGVINGSNDASADILRGLERQFPDRIVYFEVEEPGRGQALKKYWQSSQADILCYMDCDLAVSLDDLPGLISPLISNQADLAIGSRLSAGSEIKRSFLREVISQAYNILSRLLLGCRIADLQCGFKAVRKDVFVNIYSNLVDDYWFFDTELIILALRSGYRVVEIPVDWKEHRFQKRATTVKVFKDSLIFIGNLISFRRRLKNIK